MENGKLPYNDNRKLCAGRTPPGEEPNNMDQYNQLRERYPVFRYLGYHVQETPDTYEITYDFDIPALAEFHPRWTLGKCAAHPIPVCDAVLQNLVFQLGMVELVSYWKITCSPQVQVAAGALSPQQIQWWKNLYYGGLGEFFYVNGIQSDPKTFMHITATGPALVLPGAPQSGLQGTLVPIGGGKDSAVSLEVLRPGQKQNYCYIINPRGATLETAEAAGYGPERVVTVRRTLDARMLELNRQGFLNGHTPFSAIVAFSSVLTAYVHRFRYVALSNESSANESTVAGSSVNHQYSKSFAFEQDFQRYEQQWLHTGVSYFSLLRPLSEYQIAGLFARSPRYFHVFKSCNAGSKQNIWCAHCPKCLFVFIILSPFLRQQQLVDIFGANLLEDTSLQETFDKLTGALPEKPFECVGSREEINFALCETVRALQRTGEPLPALLERYQKSALYARYRERKNPFPTYYDRQNLLPPHFEALLKAACQSMEQEGNAPC